MRIAQGRIVALGYGKYVRADRIVGMEPQSEAAILADAVEGADEPGRGDAHRRLLVELLETVGELDPVLRRIVRDQAGWDLDRLEGRVRRALGLDELAKD